MRHSAMLGAPLHAPHGTPANVLGDAHQLRSDPPPLLVPSNRLTRVTVHPTSQCHTHSDAGSSHAINTGFVSAVPPAISHPLVQELAAALRSGLQGGRIEHLPPATATTGPKHCGEGALGTPTHTTAASSTGVGVGVGVRVGPEPLPEEVMLVPGCAALHPVRFLLGLADAVVRQGGGRGGWCRGRVGQGRQGLGQG